MGRLPVQLIELLVQQTFVSQRDYHHPWGKNPSAWLVSSISKPTSLAQQAVVVPSAT